MALPLFGAAGTYLTGGTRTTSQVPVPAGVTAGQIVLVHLYLESTATVTPPTGQGFVELTPAPATTGPVSVQRLFWKRASGADSGTYDFTHASAFTEGVAERYTGAAASGSPIDVAASAQRSSAAAATPAVSATTTGPDRLLVWSATSEAIGAWTPPGGFTERVDTGREITVATAGQATAGATGTLAGTGPSAWMTARVIALLPAAPTQSISPDAVAAPGAPPQPAIDQTARVNPLPVQAPGSPPAPAIIPGAVDILPGTVPAPGVPPAPKLALVIRPTATPTVAQVYEPAFSAEPRPPLRVDFWALDNDGTVLCPLPHPTAWDLSLIPGEPGAVTLTYPTNGLGFDVLDTRVTRRRDLRIRIRTDGTHGRALGALLQARDGDDVTEDGTVKFAGRFLTWLLGEAPLPRNTNSDKGEWIYPDGTAGSILGDVLDIVQAGGYLADATWTFTNIHDSNGVPWTQETSASFPPGRTVLQIAQKLREWQLLEFEVVDAPGGGVEVRAYDPSAVGTDHTLNDPPVVLRRGRDLTDAPRRADVSDAATSLLVAGSGGVYVEVDDETAIAERGRKIGQFVSEGNLETYGAAAAYGELELPRRVEGVDEITHSLTFDVDQPVPLKELRTLDWVYTDTGTGAGVGQRERIVQLTVSQQAGQHNYTGGVVLHDLIASRDVAVARQLDGLAGGQIVTGVSIPDQPVDDGKPPAQVVGVAVTSGAYPVQDGTRAAVRATWTAIDENDDGSPLDDFDHYDIQFRYTGGDLPTDWVSLPPPRDEDASWDGVVAGAPIVVHVRAVDRWGRVGAWSDDEAHVTDGDATPPPQLSTPAVDNYIGLLRIFWDGLGSVGEAMPDDFDVAQVLASETANFDPATDPYVVVAQLRGRQTYAWSPPGSLGNADYGTTWYVRLRARDKTGNLSPLSAQASAIPGRVEETDVASVNVGVLTSGISTAIIQNAGIVRSQESGARYELDEFSLRFYNAAEQVTFEGGGPAGTVSMIGTLTTGMTGRRVRLDGARNQVTFFPQSGETRLGRLFSFIPTNFPNDISIALEASDADTLNIKGRVEVRPDIALLAVVTQADESKSTSLVSAEDHVVTARVGNDNGQITARLGITLDSVVMRVQDPTTGARDGGYLAFNRGSTADMLIGKFTTTVDMFLRFGNGDVTLARASDDGLIIDATNIRAYHNNQIKWRSVTDGLEVLDAVYTRRIGGYQNGRVVYKTDISGTDVFFYDNGGTIALARTNDQGASGTFVKNFVIPHPTDGDRWLVHGCTESPHAGVEYWGEAIVEDGEVQVPLPGYFEDLTRPEGRAVWVTPLAEDDPRDRWTLARRRARRKAGPVPRDDDGRALAPPAVPPGRPPLVQATYPRDGAFTIFAEPGAPDTFRVFWLVKAVRADVAPLVVEPRRDEVTVHGDAPYRYYELKESP